VSIDTQHSLVEAGAGCGKTHGLVEKYIAELKSARPHQVLAVTFTEDAALEMKSRVLARLNDLGNSSLASEVQSDSQIGTFHGLCLRLVRPFLPERGYSSLKVISPSLAQSLRREALAQALLSYPKMPIVLKTLGAQATIEHCLNLIFRDPNISVNLVAEAETFYAKSRLAFESHCKKLIEDLISLQSTAAGDAAKSPWITQGLAALKENNFSALAAINLRSGSQKLKTEYAEVYEAFKAVRDFVGKGHNESLSKEFQAYEIDALTALSEFWNFAKTRVPKLLDFEAMEFELLSCLRDKQIKLSPPSAILIDEFQDTNRRQFEIITCLAGPQTRWYAVGDPKQSIYGFRKADVSLFLEIRKSWTHIYQSDNYRSASQTLKFINLITHGLFELNKTAYDPPEQILMAKKTVALNATPVQWHRLLTEEAAPKRCVEAIKQRVTELGPQSSHAVLFLGWKALFSFADELRAQNIDFEIAGKEAPLNHHLTQLFLDFLQSAWCESNQPYQIAALKRFCSGISDECVASALKAASGSDLLGVLHTFCLLLGPERWPQGRMWAAAAAKYLSDLQASQMELNFDFDQMVSFLRQAMPRAEVKNQGVVQKSNLRLMTIHGSKGLQFDAVYLFDLYQSHAATIDQAIEDDEGGLSLRLKQSNASGDVTRSLLFESQRRRQKTLEIAEKKRLLYVAVTRAVQTIDLFFEAPKSDSSRSDALASVLGFEPLTQHTWPRFFASLEVSEEFSELSSSKVVHVIEDQTPSIAQIDDAKSWHWPRAWTGPTVWPHKKSGRMGVSRYLTEPSQPEPAAETALVFGMAATESIAWGEDFHRLMERWNGDVELLSRLARDSKHQQSLIEAAKLVRVLPELHEYWAMLETTPNQVLREYPLQFDIESVRLTGICDALVQVAPDCLWIIDWKSSQRLSTLERADRLTKIHRQLELYSMAFRPHIKRFRLTAVGVAHSRGKTEVQALFNDLIQN
jgi:ATP-dependent exoDNAse (exonuclease V) beta subunit